MKLRSFLIFIFLVTAISNEAQTIDDAFYIYRNDGQFNAFFRDEVISIDYSYEDSSGNHYDEVVTQIVKTADSTYYIPLAVIDSISFVKPETKYKDEVVHMKGLLKYIESVDGLTVTFSSAMPVNLVPKHGDVLLLENSDENWLPNGFVGKVTKCVGNKLICDSVKIDEVYEDIVLLGSLSTLNDEYEARRLQFVRNRTKMEYTSSISFKGTASLPNSSITASATAEGKVSLKAKLIFKYKIGQPLYFELGISPEAIAKLSVEGKGEIKADIFEIASLTKSFPIGISPFRLEMNCAPVLEGDFSASMKASTDAKLGFNAGVKYENNDWDFYANNTSKFFSEPDFTGHLDGKIFGGVQMKFSFLSLFKGFSADITIKAGAHFEEKLKQDLKEIDNYKDLEDAHIDLFAKASIEGNSKLRFSNFLKIHKNIKIANLKVLIESWKIAPSFEIPEVTSHSSTSATVSIKPSGELLGPVYVGVGVWKDDSVLVSKQYSSIPYQNPDKWTTNFEVSYYNLIPGVTYSVAPMIKINDSEIKATPTHFFKTQPIRSCPDNNHPHALDFGNGTMWACCNIGASSPEDYGSYFAWGETSPKEIYSYETYSMYSLDDNIRGNYDAAKVNWGGSWVMPSYSRFEQLIRNSEIEWKTLNGVNGYKFTSLLSGASIFLPAAGIYVDDICEGVGIGGAYWSSSYLYRGSFCAKGLYFTDADIFLADMGLYTSQKIGLYMSIGLPIRPIIIYE